VKKKKRLRGQWARPFLNNLQLRNFNIYFFKKKFVSPLKKGDRGFSCIILKFARTLLHKGAVPDFLKKRKQLKNMVTGRKKTKYKKLMKKKLKISSFVTVRDLAVKLSLPVNKVISELIRNGFMVTINEEIEF